MGAALALFVGLVAVFTIFLRPYDTFNLGIFLYEGSYTVLGQNPYAVLSIPAPPNLQILGLGAYLSYAAYGYNLSGAVAFYKAANGVFAVLSALLVANMAARLVPWASVRSRVFVALLLSPPIFFFSFVHVQLDIFGIFWSLLGVYVYFFTPRLARWDFLRVLAALVLLAYSVYAYTIPIALFPAIIVYELTWRRRLFVALGSGAALLLYFVPNYTLWAYVPGNPVGSTASGANSAYSLPFVLNNIPGYNWGLELVVLWGILAVLVPVLLRFWKVDVFGALIVSILLVFLVLPIYNGDEFIWLLPWMTLGVALYAPRAPPWRNLLLVQCVLLPLIAVFNFYDGLLGMGTGVYYLFYPQFSNATVIWRHVPHAFQVAEILTGSVFAVLIVFLVMTVRRARALATSVNGPRGLSPDLGTMGVAVSLDGADGPVLAGSQTGIRKRRIAAAFPLILAVLFVGILVAFAVVQPPVSISFQADSPGFATGMFLVHPPVGDNLTYTLVNGGATLVLPPTNPAFNGSVSFIRNATDQGVNLALAVGVGGGGIGFYNTTILDSPHLQAQVISVVNVPETATALHPSFVLNVSAPTPSPPNDENVRVPLYNYSGASLTQYNLSTPAGVPTTYSFFFEVTRPTLPQNVIWSLTTGVVTSEMVALRMATGALEFEMGTTIAPGVWVTQPLPLVSLAPWNLVEITPTARGLSIALDGLTVTTIPSSLSVPRLDVGRFSANGSTAYNNSFVGWASEPMYTSTPLSSEPGLEVVVNGDRTPILPDWDGELDLTISAGVLTLSSNGRAWTANNSATFALGRLSPSTVTLSMTLSSLRLTSEAPHSLLVPFLLLALAGPIVFALLPRIASVPAAPRRGPGG